MSESVDDQGIPEDSDMAAFEADLASDSPVVDELADADDDLAEARNELASAKEDLARSRADLYNLQQDYNSYVRRAKADVAVQRQVGQVAVLEAMLSVLDDIEGARAAGELEGPFAAIADKLEDTLASRFELTRYGAVGDEFNPEIHEALMAQTNPERDHPVIGQVLQPGYKAGDKVLRPTKVMVENPE
ncbi:nucleotide exchange factor GrpE [Scrofimicrobium canadense]|nr:nucleotide exchange factor GrpE [Scrofimicrobium canadense]